MIDRTMGEIVEPTLRGMAELRHAFLAACSLPG